MEQAINKLSEMLGVGISEIYTVLQSMAKVDAEVSELGFMWGIVLAIFGFLLLFFGIFWSIKETNFGSFVSMVLGFFLIVIFSCTAFSDYRNYKMWIDNPKAYAIEKIFKSIPNE